MIRSKSIYMLMSLLSFLSTLSIAIAKEVHGQVRTSDGQPIAEVAVTDGYTIVLTNQDGNYSLSTSAMAHFVYITLPAGFDVPVNDDSANFYWPLSQVDSNISYDFVLEKGKPDSNHAFVVLGDPQVYHEADVESCILFAEDMKGYIDTALQDMPIHGMIPGDLVGDRPDLFPAVKQAFAASGFPFFYSKGNHDLNLNTRSNTQASALYEQHLGPRYYAFNRGKIHYVVLDDVFYLGRGNEYTGYTSEAQFRWLQQDLQQVPKGNTIVLMLHIPTARKKFQKAAQGQVLANSAHLYELLKDYQVHIISGHTHLHDHVQLASHMWEHNQSSISGIFWQEKNTCADGTPVGYAVYIAQGDSISWKYKSLGMPDNVQGRAYGVGKNPERPTELTALIWNYDPTWQICWYEDGQYGGEMTQYIGHDPQTRTDILNNKKNYAYDWIWTAETDHLFFAKPSNEQAELMVLATDGFGNKYKVYVQ